MSMMCHDDSDNNIYFDSFVSDLRERKDVSCCPFCKCHNLSIYVQHGWYPNKYIVCEKCGARGPGISHIKENEELIKLWNKCAEIL